MAILKNTTITDNGYIGLSRGNTAQRQAITTTILQWTTSGYTLLAGSPPTATATSWTAPTGVTSVELLVVAGGGGGGYGYAAGGGAGGLLYNQAYSVTPGNSYNISVGAGGAGATTNTASGVIGGTSFFGSGTNLIPDPTFSSGITGWNAYSANLSWYNNNSLRATATAGNPTGANITFTTVVGKTYFFKADVTQAGAVNNDARIQISGIGMMRSTGQSTIAGPVTVYDYFTATSTSHTLEILLYNSQANATITIDNVEIYNITDNVTAIGGGGGGGIGTTPMVIGQTGGSGGGGSYNYPNNAVGSPNPGGLSMFGQGFPGGQGSNYTLGAAGGGGGGAGGPGGNCGPNDPGPAGGGGPGLPFAITGTMTFYAGGGGGGAGTQGSDIAGKGGLGGGGDGSTTGVGTAGTANTGGGGGGGNNTNNGGAGGSGTIILRYSVQADNTDPRGLIRYNTDLRGLETYEGVNLGWVSNDQSRNFGGHNLLAYSDDFSTWSTGAGITVTTNQVTAPDGSLTADKVVYNGTSGSAGGLRLYSTATSPAAAVSGVVYTASIWLRADTNVTVLLYGNGNGAAGGFVTCNLTTGWQRFSTTGLGGNGSSSIQNLIYSNTGDNSAFTIYVWGGQIEQSNAPGPYVKTSGLQSPIPTSNAGYRLHTYTTTGGTSGFSPACTGTVEVLVVAGGGGGANGYGPGGAGGGGVIYNTNFAVTAGQQYAVIVGAGGTGQTQAATTGGSAYNSSGGDGGNSQFGQLVAIGGGGGGSGDSSDATTWVSGRSGGSGGGGGYYDATYSGGWHPGGAGTFGQGNYGGAASYSAGNSQAGAGGGGAGQPGGPTSSNTGLYYCGNGGNGLLVGISGTPTYYGGGGGGGGGQGGAAAVPGTGGLGGGGAGAQNGNGTAGTANTGGGGGGGGHTSGNTNGGNGGSGIVIVRYRYD